MLLARSSNAAYYPRKLNSLKLRPVKCALVWFICPLFLSITPCLQFQFLYLYAGSQNWKNHPWALFSIVTEIIPLKSFIPSFSLFFKTHSEFVSSMLMRNLLAILFSPFLVVTFLLKCFFPFVICHPQRGEENMAASWPAI